MTPSHLRGNSVSLISGSFPQRPACWGTRAGLGGRAVIYEAPSTAWCLVVLTAGGGDGAARAARGVAKVRAFVSGAQEHGLTTTAQNINLSRLKAQFVQVEQENADWE